MSCSSGMTQGEFGLPDQDYYFKDEARSTEIRLESSAHVATLFGLTGHSPAQAAR